MPEPDLVCSLIFNPCLTPCKHSAHIDKYNQNRSNRHGTSSSSFFFFFYPLRMRPMFETLVWFSVALRPQRRVGLLGTGTEWEGGERVKGSTAETARKRPERPWTAARTMEVLRRCPLAIAQRLVHCAIALSTAVLDRVTKTMSVAPHRC